VSTVRDWRPFQYARLKWFAVQELLLFVRCFQNWHAVWEATHERIAMPPLRLRSGLVIYHGTGDDPLFLYREIFLEHCYDPTDFYIPSPGDNVLDIGANIGVFMLYLQERARGIRVHCFEPAAATRVQLMRNVVENGLEQCVTVYSSAVTDRSTTAQLKQASLTGHRSLFSSTYVSSTESELVPSVALHEAINQCGAWKIDLLKIDIEGAEIEVLEGAHAGVWDRIDRVAIEFHDRIRPGCRERCLEVLRRAAYSKITVLTFGPDHLNGAIWASREEMVRVDS
jgi:FkbM family methyltransferase